MRQLFERPAKDINCFVTYFYGFDGVLDLKESALGREGVDSPVILGSGHKHDGHE